jgi:Spy/CpxP family protein refolding chaperone
MNRLALGMLGLALALLCATGTRARDKQVQEPEPAPARQFNALLSPLVAAQLKLTAEQKDKIAKMVKEYSAKQTEEFTSARAELQKAQKGGDADATKKAQQHMQELMQTRGKQRAEMETQLKEILTKEQITKLKELQKAAAGARPRPASGDQKKPQEEPKKQPQ